MSRERGSQSQNREMLSQDEPQINKRTEKDLQSNRSTKIKTTTDTGAVHEDH